MRLWQIFLVAFISIIGSFPTVGLAESKIAKIGVMLPLSGETMRSGRELQRGLELVARERGTLRYFIFEDIGNSDPVRLKAAAERLLQMQVDIVLLARTDDALAVYPLFAQKQVPLIVLLDSIDQVQVQSPLLYSSGYSTEEGATLIAKYTRSSHQARRVMVITDSTRSSEAAAGAFTEVLQADPTILIAREDYATVVASGSLFAARVRDEAVEAIYMPLTASKVRQISSLLSGAGTGPVLLSGDYVDRDALANPAFGNVGLFVTLPWLDEEGTLGASYREVYESEPVDLSVVSLAHEAGRLVLTAVQEAESQKVALVNRLDQLWPTSRTARKHARLYQAAGALTQHVVVVEPQVVVSPVEQTATSPQAENTPDHVTVAGSGEETPQSTPQAPLQPLGSPDEAEVGSNNQAVGEETPVVTDEPVALPSLAPETVESDVVVPTVRGEDAPVVAPESALVDPTATPTSDPVTLNEPSSAEVAVTTTEETALQQESTTTVVDVTGNSNVTSDTEGNEVLVIESDDSGEELPTNPTDIVADTVAPQAPESPQNDGGEPPVVISDEAVSGDPTGNSSFDDLADQGF